MKPNSNLKFPIPGWDAKRPDDKDCPYKGDTVVGNDVWIGEKVC